MVKGETLLALAESVADGSAIDWSRAESESGDDERRLVRQLRVIAELATLHRTLPADPAVLPTAFASRRTAAAPAIGRWAHLDLIERLGGGACGDVYRAFDRHLEREVALKLLHGDAGAEDDFDSSRILAEARRLARVHHANIVTVFGAAMHDGRVGLWMELVKGCTLEQLLDVNGPMSAAEAAVVGVDLCRATAALHAAHLLHRDIKTQNVMREDGGRIVLMDFGTSRLADPDRPALLSDLAGTPLYLAPEIFDGQPASARTDVYSVGVLLYRLVTGAFPVAATTLHELRTAHATRRSVRLRDARPDLPSAFVRVVERAIAADPSERYATAGDLEADLLAAHADPQRAHAPAPPRRWRAVGLAAAAVVVAAGVLAPSVWPAWRRAPAAAATVAPGAIRSIAVLPLVNVSGDPSQEYFADGMTDELIGTLGRQGGISVISRTSTMQFKGARTPLPEIARRLHVDAVLEGTVAVAADAGASGKRVRINARLIYAGTDTQLWDRTFEAVVDDVLSLQGEVAKAVADGVQLRLASATAAPRSVPRENPLARDAYLQGNYLLWKSSRREDLVKAREFLERAVQIDSSFARAYASLARCYSLLDAYGVIARPEAARLAIAAAAAAVRSDDSLPASQEQFAYVAHIYQWDWRAAEQAYRRAIELNPSDSLAQGDYARFLMAQGRLDEALQHAEIAEREDPLSAEASGVVSLALYYQRRYDEALAQRLKAAQLAPNSSVQHLGLGRLYAATGDYGRAVAELQAAAGLSQGEPSIQAELARVFALEGRRGDAVAAIGALLQRSRSGGPRLAAQYPGYVYGALADGDRAFGWLNRAIDEREPNILWLRVDPRVDPLRSDPRFERLLARLQEG